MALLVQVVAVAAVAAATAADSPRPVSKYKLAGIAGAQFHAAPRFNATESSVLHVAERPSLGRTDQVFDISTQSTARAIQIWSGISRTRDIQLLQAFHKAFSRTSPLLARLAMERIADLKSDRVALSASVLPRAAARQRQPAVGCRETQVELATGVTTCLTPGNGQSFRDCSFCPDLVVVPSGRFRLRLPRIRSDDGQHDTDVRVMIGSALAVGRFPVTRREFAIFVKATGHSSAYDGCRIWSRDGTRVRVGGSWRSPGFDQSDKHPVVCVSQEDATAYVRWLSDTVQRDYRLLSEPEWTYAAKTGRPMPDRRQDVVLPPPRLGTTKPTTDQSGAWATVPVDRFVPNRWGLVAMRGHVWQWTETCVSVLTIGRPRSLGSQSMSACQTVRGGHYIVHGGSRAGSLQDARAIGRLIRPSDWRDNRIGFRVARSLTSNRARSESKR